MSIWSRLVKAHIKKLEETCTSEVIDFMLLESGLGRDDDGTVKVTSIGDLSRYLDTLENYLGVLYRDRAEVIFNSIIESGWFWEPMVGFGNQWLVHGNRLQHIIIY